jgi:acyl-CoA synthetase (AMP-forming)/AMP-acid ligase II
MGVMPGDRLVLLVPVGIEFVSLVFALLRSGAVGVLIDPGMGSKNLLDCLAAVEPDGFVAISRAQAVRTLLRRRFPKARYNITLGRRWFWRGRTLDGLRRLGERAAAALPETIADDPAAIIFTSGSTGPAKGVLYRHETFATQAAEIQRFYGIEPGGVDLACFALFGLFNVAMGTTTVFPDIDFSRPSSAEPAKLLQAANDWQVTQAFASPAVWDRLSRHCEATGERIDSLQRVLSCGAPVPADLLRRTLKFVHAEAEMHTPYGATEALPISSIEAAEVLGETAAKTESGAGICVGRKFDGVDWKVIRITDDPIRTLAEAKTCSAGEIGELIVRGAAVTREYVTRTEANAESKIEDKDGVWHRMGDVGHLDETGRFWYCGRKRHRVPTKSGTLYTIPVEGKCNTHPLVKRSALVGMGDGERKTAWLVIEPDNDAWKERGDVGMNEVAAELARDYVNGVPIDEFMVMSRLPVDVRHNAKIDREQIREVLQKAFRGKES